MIILVGYCQVDLPLPPFFLLAACRITRGQGETSANHVGRRKGLGRDQPSVSNLVSSMSMEELRSFCCIPGTISLEVSDGLAISTIREVDSVVYFTRE